jgi:ubiquinone/menaquinone biosynthesis C-methylase UbiE/glycosyltransferase involved in cell wall biosynthesis
MIKFSFLVPTRNRPDLVDRLFTSIVDTTEHLNELEVILCIDEDDAASSEISYEHLSFQKIVVPKGLSMGALNRACFDASKGRFVMLMNDDVILRTKGWDITVSAVFDSFSDDIALVHVNDLLFREKLCTFPILSRRACEKIGICPEGYQRYRIDDHIYDIYNMLAYLGHKRIVYLDNVVFEHDNFAHDKGQSEHFFKSKDNKVYLPNGPILERDACLFDELLATRKQDVLALTGIIDNDECSLKQKIYAKQLEFVKDSLSYRIDDFVRKVAGEESSRPNRASVTIAVVTSDMRRGHARKCLALLKKYTRDFDLVVLDNNRSRDFNHPREMNKILQSVKTDFLVLMDDDVYVEPGWLKGLIECIDVETGVVTPLHRDRSGRISYAGVYLKGDGTGNHAHIMDVPSESRPIPCLCSAVVLIDMKKCGAIRFDTAYHKYFLDLDYSLQVWESGFRVVCSSRSIVTHLGGATMSFSSAKGYLLWKRDEAIFSETWIHSGRLTVIEQQVWSSVKFIHDILNVQKRCEEVFSLTGETTDKFKDEVTQLLDTVLPLHLFHQKFELHLRQYIATCDSNGFQEGAEFARSILSRLTNRSAVGRTLRSLAEKCLYAPLGMLKSNGKIRSLATLAAEMLKRGFDRYRTLPDPVRSLFDPLVYKAIKYYERSLDFMSQAPDVGAANGKIACGDGATGGNLYISLASAARTQETIAVMNLQNVTLLLPKTMKESFPGYSSILCMDKAGRESGTFDVSQMSTAVLRQIRSRCFETMVIQYDESVNWGDVSVEKFVESFGTKFMLVFPDGKMKMYERNDDLNRLIYNKVYLGSMLKFVPKPAGHRILDVGCSDGMICDLLLNERPAALVGIDIMGDVGSNYTDSRITYHQMDAMNMSFENESFDLTFSTATLEHCGDPLRVLHEMKRVTRKGGYCYVQAGPLYYSPFGHHMFGYFDDFPWIHLCLSREQLVTYCRENRLDVKIKRCTGRDVEEYIGSMLNEKHVNMKRLHEYGIQEFINMSGVKLLHYSKSYEGSSFLADGIRDELKCYSDEDLTAHGFELVFQVC